MSKNRHLFELLLDHLKINDSDLLETLSRTELTKVEMLVQSRTWHFHFLTPNQIPVDQFVNFEQVMREYFQQMGSVEIWWEYQETPTSQSLAAYAQAIMHSCASDLPLLRTMLHQSALMVDPSMIRLGVPSDQYIQTFQTHYEPLLLARFKQAGLADYTFEVYLDETRYEQMSQKTLQRLNEEDEANRIAALEIEKAREQQAPHKEAPQDEDLLIGREPSNKLAIPLVELDQPQNNVVIEGRIFSIDLRALRSGSHLLMMNLTDYTSSITLKMFSNRRNPLEKLEQFKEGEWIRTEGDVTIDRFSNELTFAPRSIRKIIKASRQDQAPEDGRRIELHAHTQMSQLDATNSAKDLIKQAAAWGHKAIAITDHGGVQAFPEAYAAGKDAGIKVIYGLEANIVNDGAEVAYESAPIELAEATYVVFDIETTGLSAIYDDIIEIGAVKMQGGQVIDRFETFVNPGYPIPANITQLTSITDHDVKDAPKLSDVLGKFQAFAQGCILVAHNAKFDINFIMKSYKKIGLDAAPQPAIDTLELSRLVNPNFGSHGLGQLVKRYNIHLEHHHRAIYDSEATGYLLYKLLEQAREQFQMTQHDQLNNQLGQGDAYKQGRPFHAILLVKNNAGLKDLFKLVSHSNVDYFYRVPRIPRSLLNQYREDLLIGTACASGEVFTAMMQEGYDEAKELAEYYDYVEIQPPSVYEPLVKDGLIRHQEDVYHILENMIRLGEELDKPVVVTGNVHYLNPEDAIYREVLQGSMKANLNREIHLPPVHFRTTDEMLAEFDFISEEKAQQIVVDTTHQIADLIEEVEVIHSELYPPVIEGADEEIRELTYNKAYELYGNPLPEIVEARIQKELDSIIKHGFAVIYLISQKLVKKSNDDGYLVGSRGSVGSSLVATLTGITEVNPLAPHYYCPSCQFSEFFTDGSSAKSGYDLPDKQCPKCGEKLCKEGQDIPFETFLGFYGDKVPDIDLNFSGEYQSQAHAYTKDLFGVDYVYRAGTIGTVANKTAHGYINGYLEKHAMYLPQAERERIAKGIEGVKRTTGQHPGGIIVIPHYKDVFDFTPIQYPADATGSEWRTTHFDFHSIHDNVLKLDILGHDDPTMIRMLQDLSGIDPISIPAVDTEVMKIFQGTEVLGVTPEQIGSETGTLGIPEFGTAFVRGMLSETRPSTFAELLQISGLSHGTDVWLGNAQDLINQNIVPLSEVIGCRDDIMVVLMQQGLEDSVAFKIMESVRKGRGLSDEWLAEMRAHNVPEWYIDSCLKIKYMFPKAHAAAYVLMALRVAYFKVYYPMYYYCAYFSVRAKDFDLAAMYQGKEMVKQRIQEINEKGFAASQKEKDLLTELEIANEMLERGYHFKMVDIDRSQAHNFVIDGDSLIPPFRAVPGLGANVAEQIVQAREEAPFLSKEDLQKRGKASKSIIEYLDAHQVLSHLPDEDQLSLF